MANGVPGRRGSLCVLACPGHGGNMQRKGDGKEGAPRRQAPASCLADPSPGAQNRKASRSLHRGPESSCLRGEQTGRGGQDAGVGQGWLFPGSDSLNFGLQPEGTARTFRWPHPAPLASACPLGPQMPAASRPRTQGTAARCPPGGRAAHHRRATEAVWLSPWCG